MKASFITSLALLGVGYALPTTSADPVRTLPNNWEWELAEFSGEGCPDYNKPIPDGRNTRLTYGENTIEGSEIYRWFIALPFLRGSVKAGEKDFHMSCDITLKYHEYADAEKTPSSDYNLQLHKNGTKMIAQYDLEKGSSMVWKFTYYDAKPEVVDEIHIDGPRTTEQPYGSYSDISPKSKDGLIKLPKCGSTTIKLSVELIIRAGKDAGAEVTSEVYQGQHYGVQEGFSYDWTKCEK